MERSSSVREMGRHRHDLVMDCMRGEVIPDTRMGWDHMEREYRLEKEEQHRVET